MDNNPITPNTNENQTPPIQPTAESPIATPANPVVVNSPPPKKKMGLSKKWILILLALIGFFTIAGVGIYFYLNQSKTPEPIASVSPTPILAELNSKNDWNTYESIKNGFSISYPENWIITEASKNPSMDNAGVYRFELDKDELEKISLYSSENTDGNDFILTVKLNTKNQTLDQVIGGYDQKSIEKNEDIKIDGVLAKNLVTFGFDHGNKVIIVIKNGMIYTITYDESNPNDSNFTANKKINDQILSTFKFN